MGAPAPSQSGVGCVRATACGRRGARVDPLPGVRGQTPMRAARGPRHRLRVEVLLGGCGGRALPLGDGRERAAAGVRGRVQGGGGRWMQAGEEVVVVFM